MEREELRPVSTPREEEVGSRETKFAKRTAPESLRRPLTRSSGTVRAETRSTTTLPAGRISRPCSHQAPLPTHSRISALKEPLIMTSPRTIFRTEILTMKHCLLSILLIALVAITASAQGPLPPPPGPPGPTMKTLNQVEAR